MRRNARRRRERRAQISVVVLAVAAGVVAGLLGTHRSWERRMHPAPTPTTSTTNPLSGAPSSSLP